MLVIVVQLCLQLESRIVASDLSRRVPEAGRSNYASLSKCGQRFRRSGSCEARNLFFCTASAEMLVAAGQEEMEALRKVEVVVSPDPVPPPSL